MKKLKLTYILAIFSVFLYTSCETTELEITSDPNFLSPEDANVDLFINGVQEDFARFVQGFGDIGSEMTRIDYMSGRNYANVYTPQTFNGLWRSAYQGMREDIRVMKSLAGTGTADAKFRYQVGMARVMEAYVMVTLVDFFGDVPYTESLRADDLDLESRLNPRKTPGSDIYDAMFAQLDDAIADFQSGQAAPDNDFFYNGDASKWIKAANTLKMKMYATTGRWTDFQNIANNQPHIESSGDDFAFTWGTNEVQPDTRHPWYADSYTSTGGARYMSNWLMNKMLNSGTGGQDPRMYYYFYRQVDVVPGFGAPADEEVLECGLQNPPPHYVAGGYVFCGLPAGYWGRDHGNDNGIPPDGFKRTLHGVYPAGGKIDYRLTDATEPEGAVNGDGNGGNGITPILLSSWVNFMKAEKALFVDGDAATAKDLLEDAMIESTAKAASFYSVAPDANLTNLIDNHRSGVLTDYDGADVDGKKEILFEQYWIAMYGNGIDAYNAYRRTGYPRNLQENIEPQPGDFIRSVYYPANYVETNNSEDAVQKASVSERVFWDAGTTNLD